ncbi:MAG TPA: cobalamin B12-binding domain-containing protein [Candidatus Dormibacteraeota bacterium]
MAVDTQRSGPAARFPVRDLIDALLGGDDDEAFELAAAMLAKTGSRTAVFADMLHSALLEINNLWYAGHVSHRDEVRGAVAVRRIVCALAATPVARPVPRGSRCILAVPPGDPHDVGLTMLVLALEDHGWSVEMPGPGASLREVAEHVVARRPRLFGLSAGHQPPLPEVERAISTIRRARVPVLVGGVAFNRRPDLWRRLGAGGLGTDVRVGVVLAQRLGLR